jgi:hypothetical protein
VSTPQTDKTLKNKLIAGASGIGAGIVVVAGTGGRRAGRIGRLVRAYFSSGN